GPVAEIGDAVALPTPKLGDAVLLLRRQSDPELEVERRRDLVREEPADGPAVDSTHQLVAEPAVGERVVGEPRAGRPEERLGGQLGSTSASVEQLGDMKGATQAREPGS